MSDADHRAAADGLSPPGAGSLQGFDLDAAWLRHAQADRAGFLARFVAIVTQALPHHAQPHTIRRGLLRKAEHVVGISIAFDTETYVMRMSDGHHLSTVVEKKVRGVVLSTREIHPRDWMQGLMARIHEHTDRARALSDLLAGL